MNAGQNILQFENGVQLTANELIENIQQLPEVLSLSDGSTLVIWQTDDIHPAQSPTGEYLPGGIKAQRFDHHGNKIGEEKYLTDVGGTGSHNWVTGSANDDNSFTIIFESRNENGTGIDYDGQYNGIFAQKFDSSLDPISSIFQVNTTWNRDQEKASVSSIDDQHMLVAWQTNDDDANKKWEINAQVISSDRVSQYDEITVNSYSSGSQNKPDTTVISDDLFLVGWVSNDYQNGHNQTGIFVQAIDKTGGLVGQQFKLNVLNDYGSTVSGFSALNGVKLCQLGENKFAAAWTSNGGGSDGIYHNIFSYEKDNNGGWI